MAKYQIKHTCGHIEEVQLFGSYGDRERKIKWLESMDCPECRKAAANAAAEESRQERGLVVLEGSDKQIAWANTIRETAYRCLDMLQGFAKTEDAVKMMAGWKQRMDAETSAKWWIDNRYNLPQDPNQDAARVAVSMFRQLFK